MPDPRSSFDDEIDALHVEDKVFPQLSDPATRVALARRTGIDAKRLAKVARGETKLSADELAKLRAAIR